MKGITKPTLAALIVLIVTPLAACSSGGSVAPQPPDLSGTWVLDPSKSDDPREELAGGRSPSGDRPVLLPPGVSAAISASRVFRIEQQDSTIILLSAEGPRYVLYPYGRQVQRQIRGLGFVRTVTRWKGEKLEVERHLDGGVKISTSYELIDDGSLLEVKTRIGGGRSIKFDRIYQASDRGF